MSAGKNLKLSELWDRSRAAIRHARLSRVETIFLIAAVIFATLVMFFYLTKIAPRQFTLRGLEQRKATAEIALSKQDQRARDLAKQRGNAEKIVSSLKDFEARLKDRQRGMTQVIDEVNQLAKAHRLAVPGGVIYRATEIETTDQEGNRIQPAAPQRKDVSLYPALGVDTTAEGDYHDLRRFISDLERSQQFVIINALVFQGVAEKTRRPALAPPPGQAPAPAQAPANPNSIPVSLKIEMDVYFQKPAVQQ